MDEGVVSQVQVSEKHPMRDRIHKIFIVYLVPLVMSVLLRLHHY